MPRIKIIEVTQEQRAALTHGSKYGSTPSFRLRCQALLLKSERQKPRTALEVAQQLGCCEMAVNNWMKRFAQQGIAGLQVRAGRGRKGILWSQRHLAETERSGGSASGGTAEPAAHPPCQSRTGKGVGQRVLDFDAQTLLEKNGCRYKRLRKQVKHRPNADVYALKRDYLSELESLSEQGKIDLLYGDESRVSLQPCVPYAWQFPEETVVLPSEHDGGVNCFALLSRDNRCYARMTEETVTTDWIKDELERFSLCLRRLTVIVLDNARVHTKAVRERSAVWQERGLFVWFLPTYSPHLNIVEVLWRKLKYEWLGPQDYQNKGTLHYAIWQALAAVGTSLTIEFSRCRKSNAF